MCKGRLCRRDISLHRGPAGEPGEVRLLGLLRERENAYLGSSSVDPEDTKS